jgi:hypothetical protein
MAPPDVTRDTRFSSAACAISAPSSSHEWPQNVIEMDATLSGTRLIICLSGHVGAGKTAVAHELCRLLTPATVCATRKLLVSGDLSGTPVTRAELQALGSQLDRDTGGIWIRDVLPVATESAPEAAAIVDAVRTHGQVAALADVAGTLFHVHLIASRSILEHRYEIRRSSHPRLEYGSFAELLQDPTESRIDELARGAQLVCSTDSETPEFVAGRVADAVSHL